MQKGVGPPESLANWCWGRDSGEQFLLMYCAQPSDKIDVQLEELPLAQGSAYLQIDRVTVHCRGMLACRLLVQTAWCRQC